MARPRKKDPVAKRRELTVRGAAGDISSGYTPYSEEISERILMRLARGENICSICADKDYPSRMTVFRWRTQYPAFAEKYDLAISCRNEYLLEECLDMVDKAGEDTKLGILKLQLEERHYAIEHHEKMQKRYDHLKGKPEDAKTIDAQVVESDPLSEAIDAYRAGRMK